MILGSDFSDKQVKAILSLTSSIERDDEKTVRIALKPSPCPQDHPPLPIYQAFIPRHKGVSTTIHTVNRLVLPAELQTSVHDKNKREGLIIVTPRRQTYDNHL